MKQKSYLCFLLCIYIFFRWTFLSNSNTKEELKEEEEDEEQPLIIRFERLHNYNSKLHENNDTVDTYYHRIHCFLNEKNLSLSSYEQRNTINDTLQKDIDMKIDKLRLEQLQNLLEIKNDKELGRGCKKSCCWSRRKMKSFYNGEKNRLPTLLDRISQIDMKLLADVHYGTLPVPDPIQLPKLTLDILPCLQNNTIIFVDTPDLEKFFREIHEKILVKYILITGDSDLSCPHRIRHSQGRLLNKVFAEETHIVHWFAMNCDLGTNEFWKISKMFTCIPQGISQWTNQRYYMQLASGKDDSIYNRDLKTNDYWILTSFTSRFAPKYRKNLWELSCHGRLKNISNCFYRPHAMDQWKYFIYLAQSKFVFSPPGVGMDCYRTWEALYFGSIPIIIKSSINSIFENLPVVIVNNYEEITLEYLQKTYEKMLKQTYDFRRLYKGYWQKLIHSYRNSDELIQFHYTTTKSG